MKDIARFRKDLKLLISSATLDAEKFSSEHARMRHCGGLRTQLTTAERRLLR